MGGWTSTVTQNTVITPPLVKAVLPIVTQFIDKFNNWLDLRTDTPIYVGALLGSSAYY